MFARFTDAGAVLNFSYVRCAGTEACPAERRPARAPLYPGFPCKKTLRNFKKNKVGVRVSFMYNKNDPQRLSRSVYRLRRPCGYVMGTVYSRDRKEAANAGGPAGGGGRDGFGTSRGGM